MGRNTPQLQWPTIPKIHVVVESGGAPHTVGIGEWIRVMREDTYNEEINIDSDLHGDMVVLE